MAPTVLRQRSLPDLLMRIISSSTSIPSTLIICLSRTTFIRLVLSSLPIDHPLLQASLQILHASRTIQIYFCDTIQSLQAHLTALESQQGQLYLVYSLRLHMHTPAFSAQGLSKTFAALSDAVARTGVETFVVEPAEELDAEEDPWEQYVPILGSGGKFAGQRGWVGRTVSVKRVAGRWYRFEYAGEVDLIAVEE